MNEWVNMIQWTVFAEIVKHKTDSIAKSENISEQQISKLAKYCINGFFDHNDIPKTMALKIISC